MNYIICALDAEAKALCEHYRLKRDYTLPYTLYRGNEIILLITQPGKVQAMMALSSLLGHRIPSENDTLINIGICGAPEHYPIGEMLLIHKIIDTERCYYPDILFTHELQESLLICVDKPQEQSHEGPVDMESAGIFLAASKFFKLHQMVYLKIVSDHFEPSTVTKEKVIDLIRSHLDTIDNLQERLNRVCNKAPLFNEAEREQIEALKGLFTKSQGDALEDAFCYFRLRFCDREFPLPSITPPESKRERSQLHEQLIACLNA